MPPVFVPPFMLVPCAQPWPEGKDVSDGARCRRLGKGIARNILAFFVAATYHYYRWAVNP